MFLYPKKLILHPVSTWIIFFFIAVMPVYTITLSTANKDNVLFSSCILLYNVLGIVILIKKLLKYSKLSIIIFNVYKLTIFHLFRGCKIGLWHGWLVRPNKTPVAQQLTTATPVINNTNCRVKPWYTDHS